MIDELIRIINSSYNIVFFGGAGVSTESGIPDFRSNDGIYKALTEYDMPPDVLLSLGFFKRKPEIFFEYYKKNLIHLDAKPNKAHLALGRLEARGKLTAVVTQNIDGLHQMGGSKNVFEVHGSVHRNNCMDCGAFYDTGYIMDTANCDGFVPHCKICGGIVKPDVVLYQESLNPDVMQNAIDSISNADTLIVGGTSLVVYPAAGFLDYFKGKNLVLINKSSTPYDKQASLVINRPIGSILDCAVRA